MGGSPVGRRADAALWVMFGALVLVWGSSFLLIKIALQGLAPAEVAFIRAALGAATLVVVLLATRRRLPRDGRLWFHMSVVALTQCAIPFTLTSIVGQLIPSSLSAIYNAVTPTLTLVLTPVLLRNERLTRLQVVGILVGVVGVAVLLAPWRYAGEIPLGETLPAQLGMLASAGVYAFGLVYLRRFVAATPYDPVTLSTMQVLLAVVPLAAIVPFALPLRMALSWEVVCAMLILGCLGTGFAYVWNTGIIRRWGASRAATVTYLMPIVGVILGIVLLGETIHWYEPVGGAIILAGVLASQLGGRGPLDDKAIKVVN
ncbi:DMT family transporter [Microbacterium sp. RD1]|uniref:DMT family transporter n=1 Tax=Microbacterium sp. RD1 TaxID=3457313 RepID=UPI003FA61382